MAEKISAREQAFIITFEKLFNEDVTVDELISFAGESENLSVSEKAKIAAKGIDENIAEIDEIIEKHLRSWRKARLSKVALAALRLGVFELTMSRTAPVGVIISEAVNICKTYGTDEDKSFVNGVLGAVARG
ncbi:MAG: transcription antitermination factor NusB [Clostridia bacterium]|nr:transcription antitermination factor NusB [Clostridia bacterium]